LLKTLGQKYVSFSDQIKGIKIILELKRKEVLQQTLSGLWKPEIAEEVAMEVTIKP
jgi:hypothetical protein